MSTDTERHKLFYIGEKSAAPGATSGAGEDGADENP